ncbi:hypothetical protein CLV98_102404 [Dyadobacter jejuensis]|uniref:Uncharacterized protein n=1 Tax=Dyadobacter jejuensis TaxID=1082580 RepID=A0A316ARV0_9BACT|nr:hypothetical protein [Dyadobacter jejuensis]PWJ59570.1 hypothetical protein CLV98_102404 [Dyadobacter jejuensis]
MKKLAVAVLALGLFQLPAVAAPVATETVSYMQDKVPVKPEDLPEAVKKTLGSDEYAGWEITTANLVTEEDQSQYFEVMVKKENQTAKIKLDQEGKVIE